MQNADRAGHIDLGKERPKVVRPAKELKAFTKVALQPGEEKAVGFQLGSRDFAHYDALGREWETTPGLFDIVIGSSSQDLTLRQTIEVTASRSICRTLTRDSLLKEFENHPKGKAFYHQLAEAFGLGNPAEADMAVRAFLNDMPVYKVCALFRGQIHGGNARRHT